MNVHPMANAHPMITRSKSATQLDQANHNVTPATLHKKINNLYELIINTNNRFLIFLAGGLLFAITTYVLIAVCTYLTELERYYMGEFSQQKQDTVVYVYCLSNLLVSFYIAKDLYYTKVDDDGNVVNGNEHEIDRESENEIVIEGEDEVVIEGEDEVDRDESDRDDVERDESEDEDIIPINLMEDLAAEDLAAEDLAAEDLVWEEEEDMPYAGAEAGAAPGAAPVEYEDLDEYDADNDLIPVSSIKAPVVSLKDERLGFLKADLKNLINELNETDDDARKSIIKAQLTYVVEEITDIVTGHINL